MKVCACLGLLTEAQARELRAAGVDRYNHNLNTASSHHARITTTHTYERPRRPRSRRSSEAGISPLPGSSAWARPTSDVVDVAFALRELERRLDPDQLPERDRRHAARREAGATPAPLPEGPRVVPPGNPDDGIRIAGGREVHLRQLPAARPVRGQLDLRRRLPDDRRPGCSGGLGDAPGPRLRDRGMRDVVGG